MVYQIEIADIPLMGVGFCYRPLGNYGPGEYKRLVNMELTDQGTLRKRGPVEEAGHTRVASNGDFLGNLEDYACVRKNGWSFESSENDTLLFVRKYAQWTNTNVVWNNMNLYASGFDPDSKGHAVVGFVRFNDSNLWFSQSLIFDDIADQYTTKFWLHRYTDPSKNISVYPTVFAGSVPDQHILLFQEVVQTYNVSGTQPMQFIKMFQFKQRLWIVTNRGIYGSKIGDFSNFTSPDGYFLKFPDDYVKDAVAQYDRIYILGNDNLSHFTYGDDINTSALSTVIAEGLGGDSLVVHEDSVFMARRDQLYLVEPNRVSKVFDLNLGVNTYANVQLTSYFDYIILCYRYKQLDLSYDSPVDPNFGDAGRYWDPTTGGYNHTKWSTNTYFLNMKTGSIMEFVYHCDPQHEQNLQPYEDIRTSVGHPINFYAMPFEDNESHDYYLLFLTSASEDGDGRLFSMRQSLADTNYDAGRDINVDFTWDPGATPPPGAGIDYFSWTNIPILVEFDSFMPDGSEMWMKKFRSLSIEGQIPASLMGNNPPGPGEYTTVEFAFGETGYGTPKIISSTTGITDQRTPVKLPIPSRVGINQRARSLTMRIKEERYPLNPSVGTSAITNPQRTEIVRLVLFWSPSSRAAIRSKGDISA